MAETTVLHEGRHNKRFRSSLGNSGVEPAGTNQETSLITREVRILPNSAPLFYPSLIQIKSDQVHPLLRNLFPTKIGEFPLAARIKYFTQNWEQVTKDPNILKLTKGWIIPLLKKPFQTREPKPLSYSPEEKILIDTEVNEMLRKGAIMPVPPQKNQFISNLFLTTKKEGKYRPVVNLKNLNACIPYAKFKMEGIQEVKDLLQPNDLMVKLDLRDAFFSVPLNQESQKLVRFRWKGKLFQFLCMCFGISPAPRIFTKVMKIPISVLRKLNIRLVIYLDDLIIFAQSQQKIEMARDTTIFLFQHLGLIINLKKSDLQPSRIMEFLGVEINSILMTLQLPTSKVVSIVKKCQSLLTQKRITIRKLSSIIGTLTSSAVAVLPAPLQYRYLQQQQIESLMGHQDYDRLITLNHLSRSELKWWIINLTLYNGKPLQLRRPNLVITSDAPTSGAGGRPAKGSLQRGVNGTNSRRTCT